MSYRDGYLGNTLGKRFQHRVESRVGDTNRRLFQQLYLWRMIDDDRIFRHRTDLLRPEYIANGKHKLGSFRFATAAAMVRNTSALLF